MHHPYLQGRIPGQHQGGLPQDPRAGQPTGGPRLCRLSQLPSERLEARGLPLCGQVSP
jgi:hypothetical protein